MDPGEAEALAIAKLRDEILLVDEKEARTAARAIGVTPMGSAGVLLAAFLSRRRRRHPREGKREVTE